MSEGAKVSEEKKERKVSYHVHRVAGTTLLRGAREGATEASGEGHLWQREQQCKGLEVGGNGQLCNTLQRERR